MKNVISSNRYIVTYKGFMFYNIFLNSLHTALRGVQFLII